MEYLDHRSFQRLEDRVLECRISHRAICESGGILDDESENLKEPLDVNHEENSGEHDDKENAYK